MQPSLALGLGAVLAMPSLASRGRSAFFLSPPSSLPGLRSAFLAQLGELPREKWNLKIPVLTDLRKTLFKFSNEDSSGAAEQHYSGSYTKSEPKVWIPVEGSRWNGWDPSGLPSPTVGKLVLFTQNAWTLPVSGTAFPFSVPWPVVLSLALHQQVSQGPRGTSVFLEAFSLFSLLGEPSCGPFSPQVRP